MTETAYASQFLSLLSSRGCRYISSYIQDPKTYPAGALHTLPKTQPPLAKRARVEAGSSEAAGPTATLTLKPRRPHPSLPPTTLAFPISTPISSVKSQLGEKSKLYPEKLQFLLKGKILKDAVSLRELVGEDGGELAIVVNIMEGAEKKDAPVAVETKETPAAGGVKRKSDEEFWGELGDWLSKTVGAEEGKKRLTVFKSAWEKEASS